jgi:2-oxoglutarate ferredoxin oxidoreductase subunit gamma
MSYSEIRLAGSGGQGLGLAGRILSQAAILNGSEVCLTQSYGPEARGGASRTDVIISDKPILFPNCRKLDILLAMNQESSDKFSPKLKETGFSIVDSTYVDQLPEGKVYESPFTSRCIETFGQKIAANLIALGMFAALSRLFNLDIWTEAIRMTVPAAFLEMNLNAFELGHREGREIMHMEEGRIPITWDRKQPVPKAIRDKYSR